MTENTQNLFQNALALHQQGQLDDAKLLYQKILAQLPEHPDSLHLLGVVYLQQNRLSEAEKYILQAIQLRPDVAIFYSNLANIYKKTNRLQQAITTYTKALDIDESCHDARNNLANALRQRNELQKAIQHYQIILKQQPDYLEAYNNLGNTYLECHQIDDAIKSFKTALKRAPNVATLHNNLGHAYWHKNNLKDAESHFRQAITLDPTIEDAYHNLANILVVNNNLDKAIDYYRKALSINPDYHEAYRGLITALIKSDTKTYSDWIEDILTTAFDRNDINYQELALVSANTLQHKYAQLNEGIKEKTQLSHIIADPLLHCLLEKTINVSPTFETILTEMRAAFLYKHQEKPSLTTTECLFLSKLSIQCFHNEYIFQTTPAEDSIINELQASLENCNKDELNKNAYTILMLSLYKPLCVLTKHTELQKIATFHKYLAPIIDLTINNSLTEKTLKNTIKTISTAHHPISTTVQQQYEEHPYPRWTQIRKYVKEYPNAFFTKKFPENKLPFNHDEKIKILVAGCGTGQHPIRLASFFSNVEITAIDLSLASLAYAKRKADEMKIDNIIFMQADILDLSALEASFHIIECVGVLHHLENPNDGLSELKKHLCPYGLIHVGVYSELARQSIVQGQHWVQQKQLPPSVENIKQFRQMIRTSPDGYAKEVQSLRDFYSISECRDCFFHAHEKRFTPPKIKAMLEELQLEFMGMDTPAGVSHDFIQKIKSAPTKHHLKKWQQYEKKFPDTFKSLYQFWCQKI